MDFLLSLVLDVINFVVLSKFENDRLVYLTVLARIDDVEEVNTLVDEAIWALAQNFVNQVPVVNE